ncbi:unnamed protein product [Schistosoma intercalatum]|nr:unnamed protein product [Schistosoma intercalatum]
MSTELNPIDMKQSSPTTDESMKVDLIKMDDNLKSNITCELYDTLIDPECKKSKLSDIWETSHTPPLECQEYDSLKVEKKDLYKDITTNVDVVVDDDDDDGDNLKKFHDTEKTVSCYRHTDDYEIYHSSIEKDICTELDNPMYIPIKLPLSSNLYVPVYYVQSSEETSPKLNKHNLDFNDSNNIHKDFINNNNNNIKSKVSHKYRLNSHDNLSKQDESQRLISDYHININNQGYENCLSKYDTTKPESNPYDLEICNVQTELNEPLMKIKYSEKSKTSKLLLKQKLHFMKPKLKMNMNNKENEIVIPDSQGKMTDESHRIEKRQKIGCSPKLKFKKHEYRNRKETEIMQQNDKPVEGVISGKQYKIPDQDLNNQLNEHVSIETSATENKNVTRKMKMLHRKKNEVKENEKQISKGVQNKERRITDNRATKEKRTEDEKQKKQNQKIETKKRKRMINPCVKLNTTKENQQKQMKKTTEERKSQPDVKVKKEKPGEAIQKEKKHIGRKEFHWSPNLSLPKLKVHGPDLSGKLHADAPDVDVNVTGPSVEMPSLKASGHLPTVDVSVPDASLGGDLSGKLDLEGVGVGVVDADLNLPDLQISGNVSAPSVEGDLSMPDVSANLDTDVKLPSVQLTGPDLRVHGEMPDVDVGAKVDVPKPHISIKTPKFGFGLGKKKTKVKTPKADVKVEGGAGGDIDLDAGLDAHLDGKARKGGKKFHWSPKFGLPKGGLKIGGGAGVGVPDTSVSVSGTTGGVDVSLPKPEFDVFMEVPDVGVSASVPEIDVSGGELGLTGKVSAPGVDVSVPSKKKKFTFGWGSKDKKAKKVKLPTVSGDVDASLDVGGKVDVPSVKVDVDSGDRVKGKKFHWSPNISLPKLKVHGPDLSGKLHADAPDVDVNVTGPSVEMPSLKASGHLPTVDVSVPDASLGGDLSDAPDVDVNVTGPSVEMPSLKASGHLPTVDVSVPDASLGGDLSGKLDLEGVGVGVVDADLNLPDLQISGNVSAPSVEGDLSMPDVSANLDTDVKLPSVQLTGPDLRVHGEMPDVDVGAKVDVPKPHISIKTPKFGFGLGKKKTKVKTPKADVKVEGGAGGDIDLDAGLDAHLDGKARKGDAPDVDVNVTGPSVEMPSLKASGHLPTVDVSVPDASLGGDLSGKLDLEGVGVGVVDADLNLPDLQISGNVSAPSVEGDLSMPDVSANLDTDVKLPSVQLTGPDLRVHGEMPDVDVGAKVDVPKPHISIKTPKFGFGLGKKKTKVKTPKADVKVEGGAGGDIDLDAGLDAHLDGKARKGGKKFHWSPKFGLPKGGLKIGGGAGVGVPDTSVSVSGTTGGVDVSLPKPELDVSMEVPDVGVSASVPEIDVSGGELGLTGKVSAPGVDVSVPSKKKKFTFGWGSKDKKAKKVKLPTVSGDVDASLDVGGKVDVPSVKVDVDSGDRVKGKKFHWSPNISLPKLKVHGPDLSGKLHADAPDVDVNVTGPSVEMPSLKASGHLPTVDVSVPDASLGGDLSGKLDLEGVGVGVVDADLNLPDLQISGNVSAPSVEGDLSMPDVSANLDTDVKLPSVQLTGPDLRVHGEMPDVDVGAKVDVPKPHISIKTPKFGFGLGKKKTKVKTPKADVKVEGGAGGDIDLDAGLDAHLDGKARKGGKKFHWSPKFGLPKGGLKIGGGAGVGVPDTSVSVSGTTGGVDVSLPKPELDVSMEVPDVGVSASVPEIDVSGGELGLTGKVSAPGVDVSVPSKKKKFTFGWGSKDKKAKKVKLPTVSGDVDASLDVGGKVDVPSVKVDVDSGDRVKGKKFHWSPNISLPKLKVHGPDLSGKLHADAPDVDVNVTGPSVEMPSLKASGHLPTVDVSVPDASLGGDLSGKLDLEGVGVGVVDADLNLPDLQISGNVSAPSVEGDLSMPDVSANLDTDVKLPSVQLTGPDLRVHGEMPDVDVGAKVDVPKPHISIKTPKFGFGLGKKKTKVKTPKADVKVEGGAGGDIDLDAGLDAHLDGKARKGGKKFHWSPKFGLPKGGLKIGGGAGVGVPDTSVSVSGTTGGVDVSLPKPELDVSMEVPDVGVSASVPEIDVSGGELGLTGKVSAPGVDVSVPSKKKKFTFGWGSKDKKAKKVKLPTVSGDVDASLDVGGKVDVPSVKVDVDSGDRVKGKKFHWSPNISLPKLKVHGPDLSGKLHADAPDVDVNVTGPSVEMPSLKASGHLPTVDVSVPDASLGGDLSGKLDLEGVGVGVVDADLNLPDLQISGNVSAPSVEGDLSMPDVSANLDTDVKLPSVQLTGPDLRVHGEMLDVDVGAKVDVPKPHISIKTPKFGFGLGKKKTKVKTPKADVKVEGGAGGDIDLDAGLDAHLDGKARKGDAPDVDVNVTGPSVEMPSLKASGHLPTVDVSVPDASLGGDLSDAPDVDVNVTGPSVEMPSLKASGHLPTVDVSVPDASLGGDLSGKLDLEGVGVGVVGRRFESARPTDLRKYAPDVDVNVTGPSVEMPSLKASGHLPTVDVSVPDASLGGDLSGKLDLEGVGVGVVDADLNLPDLQISGNVSAPSVEGDLSMPDVSANLDTDVKLPSVQLTGPDLRVHGEMPDVDVGAKVDVPKPHISIKTPKFGFGLGKKKTKVKTPKADVKVEGGAGGDIDLDAGLDAHLDGKARKGGKKFHWSPKFGLPKGGLKIGGGAGVGVPDTSVSVSGTTGGVDVSLPKPELDVSMEVPDVGVSASVPEIDVSGGELGLTGKVSAPGVDVSVPSKKKKFTFGWGSKDKKAKKVKLPTVSGDVDASLDVGGKVDVPSVKVDVDSGDRVKGKKFHWSPNISLPKLKVHGPDLSGKLHADAPDVDVNVTGPSVEMPSLKASGHLPTVDVSVPDASLGGDLSGKLDLEGVGVGVVDADLNLPDLQISGNVSAPSVEGDLSMPDVSANLDTDVKLPSVQLTGPDLRVHGEMPDVDVGAKVDVPKPHISIKTPKFGFGLGKKKTKVKTPKADVKVEGGAGGDIDLDAGLDAHLDGKARKGGKKFHWSPKFGLPKGGLKIGGGAGVGVPDTSVSVSGTTGGVDVSLPKPELDVSMEVPDVGVSASVPEIDVSGGELGLTGKVSAPGVDVSVPSKKKKFTFGWGSKDKKAKKVKLPTVSGDVDASLDVGGKVDVPSVKVDVDSGDRVKGKKFHWSPNISLPKLKVHGPDLSGKLHADAPDVDVNVTGPSVEMPSLKASGHLPTVDVSVPDASLGGDLSGKLDLEGVGVGVVDADLNLPDLQISGNVSAPSVEGDLSMPDVSANLDTDVKLPSVQLTGPDLRVHGEMPDVDVGAKVDVPKPHISIKTPKFGFGLGKKKTKVKTPKADVKVEGGAGGDIDLDAGLDAHLDGKARKGGKKFHWSPKFGLPKGGLKIGGGAGVGVPDTSVSVSGTTGGVDVSLPKPELDVSMEVPDVGVSASVPEIDVSGGELGLTGKVSAPGVDVSVPSKKKKFTFGWGSKDKKAKKVKLPTVSGDVDASLDVGGKVDVPSVKVDVDSGDRVKGKKFHWSPNISLPKLKVHGPDLSGKLHADAPDVDVNVTGPSVEMPSLKASGHLPTVDVSVPDASLGGDLSGKLDLEGVGVGVVDADLNLPDLQISGNVSAPSVEGDLSMPDVSANLDTDVKLPSVQLTGPDLRVHGEMPDVDVGAKVDVPKPHISIKTPKFGFGLGKKKTKVKTPKADVKVEGGAGGDIDLDAGLDAHLDGKARKGGKKFHWSPKFGLPKGGLKIGGGAGVGVPDTSVSVSGTTGGVDVSLPKPELDVSMEVPDVGVSASVPEIDVSGGELGLTGKVSAPGVDVSVPSKKKKFTFGWGSKDKKAKKVKLPTVSGDVDASLDVGGKVDVPSVKVDVDSGDRVKGKKFHWSPNISLPKLKVHGPDLSGKLHADAPDVDVNVTGPSVEMPSLKASGHLPTVDVSVPDASLGGDLSGKLDLEGVGVGVVDADLNLPDLQISGNVSAPSVEGDLSMPDVSANLDTDVKLPSVQLTGPDLRVHGEMPDVDVGAKVDVPKPHISIKTPKFGFGLGKKKTKVKTPKADVKVEGGAGGDIDLDAGLDAQLDGKARKGGKKFHWSPKFGLPKGGLKIGGGAGVGVPDTSVSVSGTTGGVDVSLPKPELDVSMEVPDVGVSASVPEIDVSGGELGLTGKVSAPGVDVSVPSKKKKFTFGWGSKDKKAKKVKLPTVSGDVDASLDVGGKVDVPSVKVDVDSGDRVKGKKFHWSPNISLPKLKVHGPDLSGKLHADAPDVDVNVTGPSVEMPSLKASGHLPTVDVSVPDASLGGDLSGKLDLEGVGVGVVDADLNLPDLQISGNVSAPSVEGDLSMPDVSANLDTDVKLPSVQLTGPDLRVHGEMPDVDVGAKVDVPKPHISIKTPKFGFGLGKKKTKVKTPKADVKVEGGAGGDIDLDAGLDAHLDGKARKGGKKFHWSPKFGLPKGGLKIGGGAGVGVPDTSVSVSGTTGGVDVSLPKPELDVSMEVPDVGVSASVPEIDVSGGELGLTGKVSAPGVDVSVPSKKKKFTFGWGSKDKKAKKVKLPTVSGDVDASLDVGGKVDVPSVKVDVDSGDRVKGKKFHWSPNISLPKLKVHGPDLSGKLHADAPDVDVNVTGPSVEMPSLKASGHLPTVDVSVPDASLGGDLSGKLDLEGVGVGVVDADLNLPDLQISGNVSAPSVEGDLSMPDVSANLDTDVKLPSVQLTGPDLRVHGEMPDVDVGAKVDVPKPHISIKTPKFGFGLGKKKTKVKTPKADVKVEGGAGGDIDLDAGLDAHLDGKARKGGKKFHWSPKFGLPKGGLKIGGGAGVGVPDTSVSVSGTTGGVDVSLPKPELDVSMEVPDVGVSASVPEIDVSGGELGLTGKVSAPGVDVSVPSKKKKFTFGWGSKDKKAKKVKLPTVSGDVDASLDVGGKVDVPSVKVDVPSVKVDVDSGDRVKGKKFHWSPNISLPKLKVHGPDLSGKLHADAPLPNIHLIDSVPNVLSSSSVSSSVPCVDVSPGYVLPDSCLSPEFVQSYVRDSVVIVSDSGIISPVVNFSPAVVSSPSPSDPFESVDFLPVVEEPVISPFSSPEFCESSTLPSRISPRNAFQDIDESFSSPVDSGFNGDISNDEAEIDEIFIVPIQTDRVLPKEQYFTESQDIVGAEAEEESYSPTQNLNASNGIKSDEIKLHSPFHILKSKKHDKDSAHRVKVIDANDQISTNTEKLNVNNTLYSIPDGSGRITVDSKSKKKVKSHHKKPHIFGGQISTDEIISDTPMKLDHHGDYHDLIGVSVSGHNADLALTPRRSPSKLRDPSIRKTWHGAREPYSDFVGSLNSDQDEYTLTEDVSVSYLQPRSTTKSSNNNSLNASDFLRRSIGNSTKRRPWSTLEYPPPGCHFVDDDYMFPDALTPTKIPSFRASKEIVYDVPYIDDKAIPRYEPEWPIGESRRTLISQLSQNSGSIVRMTAEEESSLISLDTKLSDHQNISKRISRFTSHLLKGNKSSLEQDDDVSKSRSKSLTRLKTWWSKRGSPHK